MADDFVAASPHGEIEELFPDIFQVKGSIKMKPFFRFSRNMTIVRNAGELTLLNSVRLNEDGLAALDVLGKVSHVVKIGGFHGVDDPFYVHRYGAKYHVLEGDKLPAKIDEHEVLGEDTELWLPGASMFLFKTPTRPEGLLRLERDGGILVSCDSLQNWAPDEYCNLMSKVVMRLMGFFAPTNIGPGWRKQVKPQASDFERLQSISFDHVLCAHGEAVIGNAKARYAPAIRKYFGVG